ncbi:MAG TPA: copper amine oxidase N-terminal domain-containing protein [Candidatus Baltobacteraceae bacterium]
MIGKTWCACIAAAVVCATVAAAPRSKLVQPKKAIAIVLNGERLAVGASPRVYKYHLMVPVRSIIEALGLDFTHDGASVVTHVGAKTITLTVGSLLATVDGRAIQLDAAPVVIVDTLYAPLRFFTDALGAQSSFDRKSNTVSIVAQLVGRSGNGLTIRGDTIEQDGTATAVDLNSSPPTITLTYNASVRTVDVQSNAIVDLQDVNANVTIPGELSDVHAGDYVHLVGDRSGVYHVTDEFGSRVGTVQAVADGQLVLDDGHVVVPSRSTQISIDGTPATVADLQRGDAVTIRYNVESNETRELLVSRPIAPGTAAPGQTASIVSVTTNATRPLRAGETLVVTIRGTPGGAARFDVGPYVSGIAAAQRSPGVYVGSYAIPSGANFADVPVIGHLRVGGQDAPAVGSASTISASSSPPGVIDFAPDDGTTVNNSRPAIYAMFASDAVPVNPSSIVIHVNGRDVTADSVRTPRFIEYAPGVSYPDGQVRITVRVADLAGNVTSKSWSFTIRAH